MKSKSRFPQLLLATFSILALGAAAAQADQCAAIERQVAERGLEYLKKGQTIVHRCELCDGDAPRAERIESVEVADWGEEGYAEIKVNGEGIDAAYVFVAGEKASHWRNLADLIGCPADGVSKELQWTPPNQDAKDGR